jgi:hypothetical protein
LGGSNTGMPQHFLDRGDRHPRGNHAAGKRVPNW